MISAQLQQDATRLYKDHHQWLKTWLSRRLGNATDGADFAQDVFLRLLTRPQSLQFVNARAYLSVIAKGMLVDHWRRRQLEAAWLETLRHLPEDESPSPETQLMFLDALFAIDKLLGTLKPQVRSAFLWAQLEGLTCPQIAQRLDVSLATVERYIATALRHCYKLRFED